MIEQPRHHDRKIPNRILGYSAAAVLVPVLGALALPSRLGESGAILWLLALVPAFLLSYYKGWRGAALSIIGGMVILTLTQVGAALLDREAPHLLVWMIVAYLCIAIGIGWVTELLHRDREGVEDLALTDLLTRLPNRRHARLFLENEFGAAQRGHLLAVVLFDLDGFKNYNDVHGHKAGDDALRRFAELLASTTRRMNLSTRFGGEEFLTILAESDEEGAFVFADRVRGALEAIRLPRGSLTVSAGVAAFHPSMRSPDELIAAADLALYRAKRDGRNSVRVFGRTADEVDATPPGEPETGSRPDRLDPSSVDVTDFGVGIGPANSHGGESVAGHHAAVGLVPPARSAPARHAIRSGVERHALVVEDESGVRELISSYLTREGYAVVEADDATGGIEALDQEFDVVITDMRLPGSSGAELVAALKERWPATQVIAVRAKPDTDAKAEARDIGADRHLTRPFGIEELEVELSEALAHRDRIVNDHPRSGTISGALGPRDDAIQDAILKGARALVTAVEIRDGFTLGHSDRVAAYSVTLARSTTVGADSLDLTALRLAGELHDVGKIAVPDLILNKEGPLTPTEILEVQKHPMIGHRILEPLVGNGLVLNATTWHHERWDGSGYPDGLSGESIPIEARIVAIADALDAMTSDRAYRKALPWSTAVERVLAEAGAHFDPDLIDGFRRALPELESLPESPPTGDSEN